jgi:hypothetical protein
MPITIKASTGALKEAAEGGDLLNIDFDGYHIFELIKVDAGKSKAGNDQLVCSYRLIGMTREGTKPDGKYWPLKDYVQLEGDTTEWKRAEFLTAVNGGKTKVEIAPNKPGSIIGNKVICRLEVEEYTDSNTGKTRSSAKIAKVLPFVAPIGGMPEADDEGDIPDEDMVVEEEVVIEEEEATEEYEPWDEASLKAAGKDKIKEVANGLGVTIVSGMTAKEVISAILEAQEAFLAGDGGEDDTEGSEAILDDEPF